MVATLAAATLLACQSRPPLANTQPSADALARAVVEAIARRDAGALRALAVNEQEFRAHVWPSLPAARPERNLSFSYVWGDLRQKSESSITRLLAEHGGQRYDLVEVKFLGPVSEYAGYKVHREAAFVVRRGGGAPEDVRVCGSFLEKDGAWKVFSYVIDD